MKLKFILGSLGLGLLLGSRLAEGQVPETPSAPSPTIPAPIQPGAVAPIQPGLGTQPPVAGPLAAPAGAAPPTAPLIPGRPAIPPPYTLGGVGAPPSPAIGDGTSAMAASRALNENTLSDAVLFGDGPATSSGLLSTNQLTNGPDLQLIGDQSPFTLRANPSAPGLPPPTPPGPPPHPPSPRLASALVPSVRGFKIAENQSPQPQDRVFFSFNYFNDLNGALNRRFDSPIANMAAYRYIFGFEKTFDEGRGSFGARLPLDQLTGTSTITGNYAKPGGTSTSLNDLSLFTKYVLKMDPKTGSLISVGLEMTLPTGPSQFASANFINGVHDTEIQPFIGYLWRKDRFYLHGFTSLSTPTSVRDVTMFYSDLGIGYFVFQAENQDQFISSVAPTFEAHINSPLTHRDWANPNDISGTPDVLNLTYGLNVGLFRQGVMTFGWVTPVTGPRPFNYEAVLLFNWRFGRSRTNAALPIVGG